MKPIKLPRNVNLAIAPTLLIFLALQFAPDNAMAESSARAEKYATTLESADTEFSGLNYLTHDNGNYHRYHFDNAKKHMQAPRDQNGSPIGNQHKKDAGQRYPGLRSGYRFRRYDRHQLGLGSHRAYDNGYYQYGSGQYGSGHHNRKFFNTLIGGTILYHLVK